jgi:quercetin dioxygenase-like cupin family protein
MMQFHDLKSIAEKEIVPGYKARFVHGDNLTLAYWEVDPGAELPEHNHPHEQVANVLEGRFELIVDGKSQILEPGQVVVIPSDVPHSGKAITPCRLLDVFHPTRDDYR